MAEPADVGAEELDAFSLLLPLPYRLATVLVTGVWCWGLNLQILGQCGIDLPALIRYPARTDPPPYLSVYRFASALTAPLVVSILLFWALTHGGGEAHNVNYDLLPNATLLAIVAVVFVVPHRYLYPKNIWPSNGRSRLVSTLKRVSVGGLAKSEDGKFGDVLLADALTSYARPLSEIYIALSMAWNRQSTSGRIDRSSTIAVPLLFAVPFLIRFRQCMIDWQPYNALKYATAFPAIALSTLMRANNAWLSQDTIHSLWLLAALANALYSFYWDVTRDWDLTLLSSKRASPDHPYGLRRVRYFKDPQFYYAVIAIDLILRFAWALKLSPHLEHFYDIEGGIFLLEILEVFRRFIWVFFRAETEWVRTHHSSDILLGDVGPKLDED